MGIHVPVYLIFKDPPTVAPKTTEIELSYHLDVHPVLLLVIGYISNKYTTSSLYATPACHEPKDIVRAAISVGDLVPTVTMMIL